MKRFPREVRGIYRKIKSIIIQRPIINYYKTNYNKNALVSYITHPFRKRQILEHTNLIEAKAIVKIFAEFGYNVDIVDRKYKGRLTYDKYDVIFGFGGPLIKSYYHRNHDILTIYYGTGMHVCYQNHATLKRIEEVYNKKGVWLLESGRIVEKAWSVQTTLVDSIITFGNAKVVSSYRKYFPRKIYNIPVSYYKVLDYKQILNNKNFLKAKNHFLWFGSSGLVHKGLDLLLETFKKLPTLHLHICGPIDNEPKFKKCYYEELYNTENIHVYGFINLKSKIFEDVLHQCAFIIFPSCSEGTASSVINVMAYGLIPISPDTSGIEIEDFGIKIKNLTNSSLTEAIAEATNLREPELKEKSYKSAVYVENNHSIEKFSMKLKEALTEILSGKK